MHNTWQNDGLAAQPAVMGWQQQYHQHGGMAPVQPSPHGGVYSPQPPLQPPPVVNHTHSGYQQPPPHGGGYPPAYQQQYSSMTSMLQQPPPAMNQQYSGYQQQPPYQMGQAQLSGHQELPQPMTTLTRQVSATANAAGVTVQHTTKLSSPGNINDILEHFAGSSPLEDVAPGSSSSSARYRKYMLCVRACVRTLRHYLYVSLCT
jgi:hypothetical protein